jgi:hypothetical protein
MTDQDDKPAPGETEQKAVAREAPAFGPRRLRPGCLGCLIVLVLVILLLLIYPNAIFFFFWMAPG